MNQRAAKTQVPRMGRQSGARFALGVDYGTNSCRALIVDVANGREVGTGVCRYPSGQQGVILDAKRPHLARQDPRDYLKGFRRSVRLAVADAQTTRGFAADRIVGIGIDTTGSTPLPLGKDGQPLCTQKRFTKNPAAMAWLWKDHTAHAEAEEITELAQRMGAPYLAKCGGTYSSEWWWSKILRCRRDEPSLFDQVGTWIELADFVPAWLTGTLASPSRGICAAGHKAMFHESWGGLPSKQFLKALDPSLADLRDRLYDHTVTSEESVGGLEAKIARSLGLRAGIPVAAGAFDAHMGAVGAGAKPGRLVKIMGTSTCDIITAPGDLDLPDIPGLCGIVMGSVVAGQYGLEAGQSAVGDIFNWFVAHQTPERYTKAKDPHAALTREAEKLRAGESGLLTLDWHNGNRTILVDHRLSGMTLGTNLQTTAAETYRSLIEATAFGALKIINRLEEYGVAVKEVVNCGGIAEKNPMVMQIYADVCNRPMKTSRSAQTCALGAAIFGAVVGGAHRSVASAQRAMTATKPKVYRPRKAEAKVYAELFAIYSDLHDALGMTERDPSLHDAMKRLLTLRDEDLGQR